MSTNSRRRKAAREAARTPGAKPPSNYHAMSYTLGKRVPADERYQGECENCGRGMWMSEHGWAGRRRIARRWCSRECRTEGNHREARARKEAEA